MINAYHSLIKNNDDWEEYLNKITLFEIFKDVIEEYKDKETITCVIRYILYAYSVESDLLILATDWQKNKENIFEQAMVIPRKEIHDDLVFLKNEKVVNVINKWLAWQDADVFRQLQTLKDLRHEMQTSCLTDIKKSSGEIDYSQKFLNAKYSIDLKVMIKDLESELVQNHPKLKDAVSEIKAVKRKNTVGVEMFAR